MMGLAGASRWEQELETWLGSDFAKALLDGWEQKSNIDLKARSEQLMKEVTGKEFTFM